MKTIEITGKNYFGKWNKTRTACRCIIVEGSKILLSYETETNQWMIPGGGLEDSESEKNCCIREVAEETGKLVEVSDCVLEIDEYYEDWKWVSKYFVGKIAGNTEIKLTQRINAYRDKCFAVQDYSAAIENMLLAIVELGYESCWYEGHITDDDGINHKMEKILKVPQGYELVCFLPVGVAEEEQKSSSRHPKKKAFDERAWFNCFGNNQQV